MQLLCKEIKNNQIIYNSLTKKQEEIIGELSLEQILTHYTLFEDKAALKLYNDNKKNTDAAYSRRMVSPFKTTLPICTSLFLVHFIPKCTSKINLQVFNFNIPFYSINKEALSRIFSEKKLLILAGILIPTAFHACKNYRSLRGLREIRKKAKKETQVEEIKK